MTDTKYSLQEDFKNQLREFDHDTTHEIAYRGFKPRNDKVLVKLFKFVPTEQTKELGSVSILVKSPLNGEWKPKDEAINSKIFPICKVLRVGSQVDDDVKVGDLYIVPTDDVVGMDWNPDFMWMMQNFAKQGKSSGQLVIPDDMEQKLPKLEKNWGRYKFAMPDRIGDATEEDRLVYLVPQLKLEADYEYFI